MSRHRDGGGYLIPGQPPCTKKLTIFLNGNEINSRYGRFLFLLQSHTFFTCATHCEERIAKKFSFPRKFMYKCVLCTSAFYGRNRAKRVEWTWLQSHIKDKFLLSLNRGAHDEYCVPVNWRLCFCLSFTKRKKRMQRVFLNGRRGKEKGIFSTWERKCPWTWKAFVRRRRAAFSCCNFNGPWLTCGGGSLRAKNEKEISASVEGENHRHHV